MKVLQLPNSYLPWSMGGKEVYTHELCKNLLRRNATSEVLIHRTAETGHPGVYQYEGVRVNVMPSVWTDDFFASRFTREIDGTPGFEDFISGYKPDIIHFHDQNDGASLTHLRIARKHKIKTVLTFHTPGQLCPQRALLYKGEEACHGHHILNRCTYCQLKSIGTPEIAGRVFSRIGLNSGGAKGTRIQKLLKFRSLTSRYFKSFNEFCSEADVIHLYADWARDMFKANGVPESKIRFFRTGGKPFMARVERSFDGVLKLVFAGRCTPVKGIHLLIDAVKSIDPSYPVEVHFFGPDWDTTPYGKRMYQKIENDHRFKTPRVIPNHLLQEELSKMDVCVIPSVWLETGPITVFDAFSARLPIIGSRLGGIAELVEDKRNGILFTPGNVSELRAIIENLLVRPDYLKVLKANIIETRTMEAVASDTLELYNSMVC